MNKNKLSRRTFIRNTSLVAAGTIAGVLTGQGCAPSQKIDTAVRKTPSYNPDMEYRRLGKTGLWVSAVCLGGHWKRVNVMNQDFAKNRSEVVTRCMEVGINYIDACWDNEVKAYSKALAGRRDKMYMALSHGAKETRNDKYRTAKKLLGSLDELLWIRNRSTPICGASPAMSPAANTRSIHHARWLRRLRKRKSKAKPVSSVSHRTTGAGSSS